MAVSPAISPEIPRERAVALRTHYPFLDGMRACAAFYVVCHHVYGFCEAQFTLARLPRWATLMSYGHFAVSVFIVLSGFCLMLPVAQSPANELRGGFTGFIRRRARRILPPYYMALLLAVIWTAISQGKPNKVDLLLHLSLLHNLREGSNMAFSAPLWSVATEWQIYFVFALALLPCFRRFGALPCALFAFLLGLAPHFLLPASYNLDWACFWYLGLFALGMAGAHLAESAPASIVSARRWLVAACGFAALFLCGAAFPRDVPRWAGPSWLLDILAAMATVSLILHAAHQGRAGQSSRLVGWLESRPALAVGAFSYSLYLIHYTVLDMIARRVLPPQSDPQTALIALSVLGIPAALLAAYLFHLAFERPFLSSRARAAIVSRRAS